MSETFFVVPFGAGSIVVPPPGGNILASDWVTYSEPVADPQPVSGGQFRVVTDQASANAAKNVVNPGDVIIFTGGGIIPMNFDTRIGANGINGTEAAPITVTTDANTWLGPSGSTAEPILAINRSRHFDVVKCKVNAAGGLVDLPVRLQNTGGTAARRQKVHGNTIINSRHAHLSIQSWFSDYATTPSSYIDVANNFIDGGPTKSPEPHFCEGIYLGRGTPAAVDRTNNISIRNNWITRVSADAIDIKPATSGINVLFNEIYDIELHGDLALSVATGAISAMYGVAPFPVDVPQANSTILGNRLYDIRSNTTNNVGVFPPITVGQGGMTVMSNGCWDFDADHAIAINGETTTSYGPGTFFISNNTTPSDRLLRVDPRPGAASYVYQFNIPTLETLTSGDVGLVGPTTGLAEANSEGPGSGLAPVSTTAPIGATGKDAASDQPNPYPGFLLKDQR